MTAEIELHQSDVDADVDVDVRQRASGFPYMPFGTFKNMLERFNDEGLPARFDGSYFSNVSGSTAAQTRSTFRFFDFIDDNREPTEALKRVSEMTMIGIPEALKPVVEVKYAEVLALPPNATYDQLAEVMREKGINGATARKAISFFISLADEVGVSYSPHFKKGRSAGSTTTRRKPAKKVEQPAVVTPPPTPTAQQAAATSKEALRAKYVNLLMEKVEKSTDDLPGDLLDRIERALGYEDDAPTTEKEVP